MTRSGREELARREAVSWFVRLSDCEDEGVWQDHLAWLERDAANVAAYDEIESAWVDADGATIPGAAEASGLPVSLPFVVPRTSSPTGRRWWIPTAIAAAMIGLVAVPQIRDHGFLDAPVQRYATGRANTRVVELEDGSRVTLNRDTRLTVTLSQNARSAALASGEAVFDIRHDPARPFTVAVGGRDVRVLGTEFDIVRQAGSFGVTVRRGLVAVSEGDGKATVRLPAGTALRRDAGEDRDTISRVDADDLLAWTSGRLIYNDRPIDAVARDLGRYTGDTVAVDPRLRSTRVTGVVEIGDTASLEKRFEQILPIRVVQRGGARLLVPAS